MCGSSHTATGMPESSCTKKHSPAGVSPISGSGVTITSGLCPKCHIDHEIAEKEAGRKLPVVESELCMECKTALGYVRAEGEDNMKRKKRKYTKRDEVALIKLGKKAEGAERAVKPGKKVRLGRETRKLIKGILKSGKKALKLEEKAEKSAKRGDTFYAKSKALREQAANMRAEIEALKDAVNGV